MRCQHLSWAVLPALLAPCADAQVPGHRTRVVGRVVGLDGEPRAGAKVTLRAEARLRLVELGAADEVVVETDAKGRFRARVLTARDYSVLGQWQDDDDRTVFTRYRGEVKPGARIDLVENDEPPMALRLRVHGLEAWKERGGLRVVLRDLLGRRTVLAFDEEGEAALPPLPGATCYVLLETPDGRRLSTKFVQCLGSVREKMHAATAKKLADEGVEGEPIPGFADFAKEELPPVEVERILVPPPLVFSIRVVDKASKKPVAGALVRRCESPNFGAEAPEVRTDAEGRASFVLLHPIDSWGRHKATLRQEFHVFAKGYAIARCGWYYGNRRDKKLEADAIVEGRAEVDECELAAGHRVHGRILLEKGKPAAGLPLVVRALYYEQQGAGGGWSSIQSGLRRVVTDAEGRYEIGGFTTGPVGQVGLAIVFDPERLAVLGAPIDGALPTQRLLPVGGMQRAASGTDRELPDLDLSRARAVDLTLRGPDGRPAAHAELEYLGAKATDSNFNYYYRLPAFVRADRRGRCRALVLGDTPHFSVFGSEHYLFHASEKPKAGQEPATKLALELEPYLWIRGRVVDGKGESISGAEVRTWGSSSFGGRRPWWFSLATNRNRDLLRAKSDDDGRFALPFIPTAHSAYQLRALWTGPGRERVMSQDTVEVRNEAVDDAELVLDVDPAKLAEAKTTKKAAQARRK